MQRQLQPGRHVGDEAGLAAAGGALDQQRQAVAPSRFEHRAFVAERFVVRFFLRWRLDMGFHGDSLPFAREGLA